MGKRRLELIELRRRTVCRLASQYRHFMKLYSCVIHRKSFYKTLRLFFCVLLHATSTLEERDLSCSALLFYFGVGFSDLWLVLGERGGMSRAREGLSSMVESCSRRVRRSESTVTSHRAPRNRD